MPATPRSARTISALSLLVFLVYAGSAAGERSVERPWILVEFAENPWPPGFIQAVEADLRAGFRDEGIELRAERVDGDGGPLAVVRVAILDADHIRVSIDARDTVTEVPSHAGVPGAFSGRQRRHGRNPAASAAAAHSKNRVFSRRGVRAGQIGRQ